MKHVRLKSLSLVNWRGERKRTSTFDPISTTIAGANGLGKSRHFDAFMWLLFGKDSQDRKDYNIKSIVEGQALEKTDSEVLGALEVDGEVITLRRVLVEEWVKPRGQAEQVFKGNKTECYWNDTPVSVTEYQKRVGEVIDERVFKILTNPYYFASLPWKAQRDHLFELAGTITDHEVASLSPEFSALLERLSGKSFADFKRELSARKKRLKEELGEIQPRIDQTQKLMPEAKDYTALEEELSRLEAETREIDKAIADTVERSRLQQKALEEQLDEINALKLQRRQVLYDAESKERERVYSANAERRNLEERISVARKQIEVSTKDELLAGAQINRLQGQAFDLANKADDLRISWYVENEAQYDGKGTCISCGQELTEAMQREAVSAFMKGKQFRLEKISEQGKALKTELEAVEKRIAEVEEEKLEAVASVQARQEELKTLEAELEALPVVGMEIIQPESIQAYTDLTKQIEELEAKLTEGEGEADTSHYQARREELSARRDEVKAGLRERERIEQFNKQIATLEDEGRELAQQIADAEREEYTVQQFTKAKIDECEKRINGLFSLVSFRLFEYTIEDAKKENPIETCIPLVKGVPFAVANTAGQVNAGLDIINTLTRFYGVSAPIFIDNRESVSEIIPTQSQIINLLVTQDKELVIKY